MKALDIIKLVITKVYDDEKAKYVETEIIRFGTKIILLHRDEDISKTDINELKPLLKDLWNSVLDYAGVLNFEYDIDKISPTAIQFFKILKMVCAKNMTEDNIQALQDLYDTIFNKEVMDYLFLNEDFNPERRQFLQILERYYNFK